MPRNMSSSYNNSSFSVQKEIMDLKSQLSEKESELIRLECGLVSSGPESTTSTSSTSDVEEWQAKYERLAEAHKKLQRNNISLEDKLLKIVDKFEGEKNLINRDLATQTQKVVEAKLNIQQMHKQNTQLKSDLQVALNILQMKPNSFVSQKMESLPDDLQTRVKQYQFEKSDERKNFRNGGHKITVAVPNGAFESNDGEAVSAAILAKVLEERENERKKEQKFCIDIGTQTHRWQFPDKLLRKSRGAARHLLKDEFSLLEELTLLKEFSNVRKQLLADKGYLEESDCLTDEDDDDNIFDSGYPKSHTHVSNILLASLMQSPASQDEYLTNETLWSKSKFSDNVINLKKEKEKKSLIQEPNFELQPVQDFLSESESLQSFNLLGSNPKLSNFSYESQTNIGKTEENDNLHENHYESLTDLRDMNFYQRQETSHQKYRISQDDQHQIYSSQPTSISSLFSLTQKAFTPNTLQRSFSTSSYSAVQTEL